MLKKGGAEDAMKRLTRGMHHFVFERNLETKPPAE